MNRLSNHGLIGAAAPSLYQGTARPHACSIKARPIPGGATPPTWEELLGRR